jgi:HEAT repeat protein
MRRILGILRPHLPLAAGCALAILAVLLLQPAPAPSIEGLQRHSARAGSGSASAPAAVELREVGLDWNIAAVHEQSSDVLSSLSETLGGGVCAIDFDRDGFIDLFFVGGSGHTREYGRKSWWRESRGNRLLANKGGRRFEDVTARAKLDVSMWGMGCAVGDLDNDGFADLIVTGVKGNRVFRNRGDSTFEDVTARSKIASDHWSTGASLADFNGDGLLDIYVSNYILYDKGARTFERTSGFRTVVDAAFDQTLYDAEPHRLYVNSGGFAFKDVAAEMGVADAVGRSLGARWVDMNADRWPDLLVINDHDTPNQFYINEHGEHFARASGANTAFEVAGSHDVAFADFDNDGRAELFMSRGRGRPSIMLAFSASAGRYRDVAWDRGVAGARLLPFAGWAAVPADLNNDGYLDLYVANGLPLPDADSRFVAQAQPNSLFLNDSRGGFRLQPPPADAPRPHSSRGAIAVDLDNDGRLELVVANNNDPFEVHAASGSKNHWLVLDLHSAQRDAAIYGATITAQTAAFTITRSAGAPQHFLSQGDPRIHLGLGSAARVEKLQIDWRDGGTSVFRDVAVDQFLTIDRSAPAPIAKRYPRAKPPRMSGPPPARDRAELPSLVRILLAAPAAEDDVDGLRALWQMASAEARSELLRDRPQALAPVHLALVRDALRDPTAAVRRTAVELLRESELERSVSWLVPLFDDSDPQVQCAVADAFRFFFDEEEAVTERKALAISPLIRLLTSGSAPVKVCAATALASSESKRAVLPLIELASSPADPTVKVAAARALGLIRDTRAIEPLRALVHDPDSDGSTAASSLIALSRLKDPELASLLDRMLAPPAKPREDAASARPYEAMAYFFAEPDSLVLPRPLLVGHLERLLSHAPPPVSARGPQSAAAIAALRAIGFSRVPSFEATAARFLASPEPDVRAQALVALSSLDSPRAQARMEARLLAEPTAFVRAQLPRLEKRGLRASFAAKLFARPGGTDLGLEVMRSLPKRAASEALNTLLRGKRTADEMILLLELCADSSLQLDAPGPSYDGRAPLRARAGHFACLLNRPDDADAQAAQSPLRLRARSLLKAVLADPAVAPDERRAILLAAARHDPVVARTWLAPEIDKIAAEYLPDALRVFQSTGTVEAVADHLWRVLENARTPDALRMQVAEALSTTHRERVVEYLYSQLESP